MYINIMYCKVYRVLRFFLGVISVYSYSVLNSVGSLRFQGSIKHVIALKYLYAIFKRLTTMNVTKSTEAMKVSKVDKGNKLVFGWATVCLKNGEPYYDTDNQHLPEDVTLKGWIDFMQNTRVSKAMHDGNQVGDVVFAFPATEEIVKSLGMGLGDQSGVIVGVVVNDEATLNKFHDGTYQGFSIGGSAQFEDQ